MKEDHKPNHTKCAEALELAAQSSCGTSILGDFQNSARPQAT